MGEEINEVPIPEDMKEQVEKYRAKVIEKAAENDEALTEKYLKGEELTIEEIKHGLRTGVVANKLYVVLCGSSLKNIGVQLLLDAVIDYLPSPLDVPPLTGINPKNGSAERRAAGDDDPFCALAFKIATDPFVGKLTFFRVYSGVLKSGSYVYN